MTTDDQPPVRIGVVGLGYIGTTVGGQFHRHPAAGVTAVCDLDADRLGSAGEEFGGATLERDLHVYCDEPLTTALDRARDLVARDERWPVVR